MVVAATAVGNLGLAQFHVRMARVSTVETTGISLFAFMIFGLVTLFAVTRMRESLQGKLFAALINIVTGICATWYLQLLFEDELFFRNLHYAMNRQTREWEALPASEMLFATMPLVCIIIGAVIYYAAATAIIFAALSSIKGKSK
jgi:hypothetical protein